MSTAKISVVVSRLWILNKSTTFHFSMNHFAHFFGEIMNAQIVDFFYRQHVKRQQIVVQSLYTATLHSRNIDIVPANDRKNLVPVRNKELQSFEAGPCPEM